MRRRAVNRQNGRFSVSVTEIVLKNEERAWFGLRRFNGFGHFEEDRRWSSVVGGCCEVGIGEEIRLAEPGFVKIGIGMKGKKEEEEGNEKER